MNKSSVVKEAFSRMPRMEPNIAKGFSRVDIASLLDGKENIGIELGVATGLLATKLLTSGKFRLLFGVDVYGDMHDTVEYKKALLGIGLESSHKLLRLTFDDALDIFPDSYFDFIYVDGFAHTGEEGGLTLASWYRKLKVGGIMSGDDYHPDWPLVMWAVNHFALQLGEKITLTEIVQNEGYSRYPSWFMRKDRDVPFAELSPDLRLLEIAMSERRRIHRNRMSPVFKLKRKVAAKVKSLLQRHS